MPRPYSQWLRTAVTLVTPARSTVFRGHPRPKAARASVGPTVTVNVLKWATNAMNTAAPTAEKNITVASASAEVATMANTTRMGAAASNQSGDFCVCW